MIPLRINQFNETLNIQINSGIFFQQLTYAIVCIIFYIVYSSNAVAASPGS
jgi:hypothetical protein